MPEINPPIREHDMSDDKTAETAETAETTEAAVAEALFTQQDLDKLIGERLKRERETVQKKYGDLDALHQRASAATTVEDRVADLESRLQAASTDALRTRVAAAHGISTTPGEGLTVSDADLFLTASDEETMTQQAERLASHRTAAQPQFNTVAAEGAVAPASTSRWSDILN